MQYQQLSEKQQEVVDYILSGKSCALLGQAGSGKTHVLKIALSKMKTTDYVVCASTAGAANNIGLKATTAHSLFGLRTTMYTPDDYDRIPSKKVKDILSKVKTIVIEEVGMIRRDNFEKMDYTLRKVKNNNLPWGGVQIVFVGDFGQIEPVLTKNEIEHFNFFYDNPWCFTSDSFKFAKVFNLTEIFRQSDTRQRNILNSIRNKDKHYVRAVQCLNNESRPYDKNDLEAVTVCSYHKDADLINEYRFSLNKNPVKEYISYDTRSLDCDPKKVQFLVEEKMKLKKGLLVKICANDPNGSYFNGMIGVITQMEDDVILVEVKIDGIPKTVCVVPFTWEIVEYEVVNGSLTNQVIATREQFPLKLAYALTVHSCQGMTMDKVNIHLGYKTYAKNLAYVALSRVRDLTNISFVRPLRPDDIIVDQAVINFYNELEKDDL